MTNVAITRCLGDFSWEPKGKKGRGLFTVGAYAVSIADGPERAAIVVGVPHGSDHLGASQTVRQRIVRVGMEIVSTSRLFDALCTFFSPERRIREGAFLALLHRYAKNAPLHEDGAEGRESLVSFAGANKGLLWGGGIDFFVKKAGSDVQEPLQKSLEGFRSRALDNEAVYQIPRDPRKPLQDELLVIAPKNTADLQVAVDRLGLILPDFAQRLDLVRALHAVKAYANGEPLPEAPASFRPLTFPNAMISVHSMAPAQS